MDRSQITPRRYTYLTLICVVFLAFALLAAGCSSKDTTSPATTVPKTSGVPSAPGNGVQNGDLVEIEYTGTLANGSVFDSSKDRGPFQFVIGTGTAIEGFDNEIRGMKVGESKKFTLRPEEAYGYYNASLIKVMPIDFIPVEERMNVSVGDTITLFNGVGYFPATIANLNETNVTFDLNSPLAGQSLTFDVSLVNLTPAKDVEAMMAQYAQNAAVEMPVEQTKTT
jgi:FKBP-type peptidyl-prolyl cis-trans isomerase 2